MILQPTYVFATCMLRQEAQWRKTSSDGTVIYGSAFSKQRDLKLQVPL